MLLFLEKLSQMSGELEKTRFALLRRVEEDLDTCRKELAMLSEGLFNDTDFDAEPASGGEERPGPVPKGLEELKALEATLESIRDLLNRQDCSRIVLDMFGRQGRPSGAYFAVGINEFLLQSAECLNAASKTEQHLAELDSLIHMLPHQRICAIIRETDAYIGRSRNFADACRAVSEEMQKTATLYEQADDGLPPLSDRSGTEEPEPDDGAGSPQADSVQFSAIAPKTIRRGEYALLDIVMYEPSWRHIVDEMINGAEEPVQEKGSGIRTVGRHAQVRAVLSAPELGCEDQEETLTWEGGYLQFSFACEVPDHFAKSQVLWTVKVYVDDVLLTRMHMTARCEAEAKQVLLIDRADVRSAFVSYASQDRPHVAAVIQGMKTARPDLDVFFDVESLRRGENWEERLYREIDARDVLFLCWSRNAKASRWVDTEWRYALQQKGIDSIEPVPLEMPDRCPPPAELEKKHFSDRLLYIIHANQAVGPHSEDGAVPALPEA
ncbi:MAG: toll/interleukin-1 receptor domain-containing protein [Clostridia bacterium]|nr:toll/interleukin-1 receptor domain-containing protein [Clostridia bacterium]